ncbi:MAG: hypothetical protein QXV01_11995 [Candidatus Bathyarchaeia archaeon]
MSEAKKGYKKVIVGIAILAVVVVVLFVPLIPVDVTYSETEPYNRECQYEVVSATLRESWDIVRGTYHISEVTIKNIDSYGGTFTVTHYLYDVNGLYGTKQTSEYLAPGETKAFKAEFDTQWLQDVRGEYSVSAPTVIDQRVVTKHKTVYKSIIEILIYG